MRLLIEPGHDWLSVERQCEILGLARSTYYYTPVPEDQYNLTSMRLMDEQYLKTPFYGVMQMTYHLHRHGHQVNPKRVRRLLRKMGLVAVCPGPHTSKPSKGPEHQVFPYLLKGKAISAPGQVVGTDITYIPMPHGFLFLVAFIDWYSRYVLSWELSNTMSVDFCLTALDKVWPQLEVGIINTDQGPQFTSRTFVEAVLSRQTTALSMDGKGRAIDNVFTERLWRSLKYEEVYLNSYQDGHQAWKSIDNYWKFYNNERPNSKLNGHTPADVFCGKVKVQAIQL